FAQLGDIHVAEKSQHQRPRDRRRGKDEKVDRLALAGQRQPLMDAKAMLLVDDGEREIAKGDIVLKESVGADNNIDIAVGETAENFVAFAAAFASGQNGGSEIRRSGQ